MKEKISWIASMAVLLAVTIGLWTATSTAYGKTRDVSQAGQLTLGETGRVNFIINGDGFILESGLKVKLAGIQAPQRAWPEREQPGFPLADEAAAHLRALIKGKSVSLYYGGERRDRYDRAIAQVWLMDENGNKHVWLQEAMVKAGYARVYFWPDQSGDFDALYAAEREARAARDGIWNNRRTKSFYKIRKPDPNPLAQDVDSVQLVEGLITSTANVRGTVYLNFGSDYKTDFTVGIGKKRLKSFEKAGIDPTALEGARVRVRGWIELQNGPIIWLNDPRRLEILN